MTATAHEELLPCPFCGSGPARTIQGTGFSGVEVIDRSVLCGTCGSTAFSVADWNTRASAQRSGVGEPVAWRYQRKEGWEGIWRYSSLPITDQDFETPSNWTTQPLYARSETGHGQSEVLSERAYTAAVENIREAWVALRMIREAVETLAPSGSVKASEHLDGPTFTHEAEALVLGILALATRPADTSEREVVRDWKDDPSADERWNAGVDFAMKLFCEALSVNPSDVRWDAATETVQGDVSAVIGNILRTKFGEDFDRDAALPVASSRSASVAEGSKK